MCPQNIGMVKNVFFLYQSVTHHCAVPPIQGSFTSLFKTITSIPKAQNRPYYSACKSRCLASLYMPVRTSFSFMHTSVF